MHVTGLPLGSNTLSIHPTRPTPNSVLVIAAELDVLRLDIALSRKPGAQSFSRSSATPTRQASRIQLLVQRRPLRSAEVLAPLDSTFHSLLRGAANCDDDMSQLRVTAIQTHRRPSSNAGDWLAT
jgi:hypothetical protein